MASSAITKLLTSLTSAATNLLCQRQPEQEHPSLKHQQPPNPPRLTLETIPLDILYLITTHLDYPTALSLSSTSKSLHNALQPGITSPKSNYPITLSAKIAFFRLAETTFPRYAHDLTCFSCFRLLPKGEFSPGNRSRYKGSADWAMHESKCWHYDRFVARETYRDRFCWTCGVKELKFEHLRGVRRAVRKRGGREIVKDPIDKAERERQLRELWYLCHQCGEMKRRGERCFLVGWLDGEGEGEGRGYGRTICSGVFEERVVVDESVVVENDLVNKTSKPATLKDLPTPIQQVIFALLPYRDRIMISQASKHFHAAVQPGSYVYPSVNDKFTFIREREATKHRARTGARKRDIACYGCFRMRPVAKFSKVQLDLTVARDGHGVVRGDAPGGEFWKRRCNSCLERMWCPGPGGVGELTRRCKVRSEEELKEAEILKFYFGEQAICEEKCCKGGGKGKGKGKGVRVKEVMRYMFEPCEGCVRFEEDKEREEEERRAKVEMREGLRLRRAIDLFFDRPEEDLRPAVDHWGATQFN